MRSHSAVTCCVGVPAGTLPANSIAVAGAVVRLDCFNVSSICYVRKLFLQLLVSLSFRIVLLFSLYAPYQHLQLLRQSPDHHHQIPLPSCAIKLSKSLFSPKNPVTVAFFVTNQIEALGCATRVEVTAFGATFWCNASPTQKTSVSSGSCFVCGDP